MGQERYNWNVFQGYQQTTEVLSILILLNMYSLKGSEVQISEISLSQKRNSLSNQFLVKRGQFPFDMKIEIISTIILSNKIPIALNCVGLMEFWLEGENPQMHSQ